MTYNRNRLFPKGLPGNNYTEASDYDNEYYYIDSTNNLVVESARLDFGYSAQVASGQNLVLAQNQKIGPFRQTTIISEVIYVLDYRPTASATTLEYISVDPTLRAGLTSGGTEVHGDYNVEFTDFFGLRRVVGCASRPGPLRIKKDVVVNAGGYVWVRNTAANNTTVNHYYVTCTVIGLPLDGWLIGPLDENSECFTP